MTSFHLYLKQRITAGGFATEDTLAAFLPLMEQVADVHGAGYVAPLEGIERLSVEGRRLHFSLEAVAPARHNLSALRQLQPRASAGVSVVRSVEQSFDLTSGQQQQFDRTSGDLQTPISSPVWLPDYVCWEHRIGHHDPLTDVFSLGMILASLACGLDFTRPDDLHRFVAHRGNLFRLRADLHPVLARVIVLMTELDRHQRPADLLALRTTLEEYRDQEVDFETDLARESLEPGSSQASPTRRILSKLQERLFEINRRNRLLHFRATAQSINLTEASIPLSFDVESIRPKQVLTWSGRFLKSIASGKTVVLNRYLNFREAVYLPGALDRIRTEARRDENDYGFAQLRLVIAFMRWSDLKVEPAERYESPLLLVPVRLSVRRGIHDRYLLQAVDAVAEVNPVVRHQFLQLYGISLPESVDLTTESMEEFTSLLRQQIVRSDQSVTLRSVDQPRVEIIHARAKRRLDQHCRRVRSVIGRVSSVGQLTYSYDPVGYEPLGIQYFERFVRPPETWLEQMVSAPGSAASHEKRSVRSAATDREKPTGQRIQEADGRFYRLRDQTDDNPRHWEIDFCSVTLANLKYRRMSLARDYAELISLDRKNAAFEAAFALVDRAPWEEHFSMAVADRFNVLPADPTQMSAVAQSATGRSYIIQGPPGTGKSQTIANLIAELVQRGRRILFVCEKRAAVDVVHHRLRQLGLEDLCCLIHDSQADKKQFVMDLKQSFQDYQSEAAGSQGRWQTHRNQAAEQLQRTLSELQQISDQSTERLPGTEIQVRQLYDRLLDSREAHVVLAPVVAERVPSYDVWLAAQPQLDELQRTSKELSADGILAHHPVSLLSSQLLRASHPVELVQQLLQEVRPVLLDLQRCFRSDWPAAVTDSLDALQRSVALAQELDFLTRRSLLDLLNTKSSLAQRFSKALRNLRAAEDRHRQAAKENRYWTQKLSSHDTQTALQIAGDLEQRWTRWFSPRWWQLRRQVRQAYDFDQHSLSPSLRSVLQKLDHEYECEAACYQVAQQICDDFDLHLQLDDFLIRLDRAKHRLQAATGVEAVIGDMTGSGTDVAAFLQSLTDTGKVLAAATRLLDQLMQDYGHATADQLLDACEQLSSNLHRIPEYLHCVSQLDQMDDRVEVAVRTVPATFPQLERTSVLRSLRDIEIRNPVWAAFRDRTRAELLDRLAREYDQLQHANAKALREQIGEHFSDRLRLTERSASQLDELQKRLKKTYSRGRRVLEHEFGKSMRYKSIRELASGDSGQVVRDLKPVWLMSPLSVSDTLPLDEEDFDTVIFDEASQITLEDAVPALFRAAQTIVVGDEMQLPPTSFFSSRSDDDDDFFLEEEGERVYYDLNSSSLLNHAAHNLPSTLLGWHYRSQSESLISFSNHAFYGGRLLTVPEERLPGEELPELSIDEKTDVHQCAAALVNRPVSFHFMENGVYDKRRNQHEADYIAELVRSLLMKHKVPHSIGIVAFSEAQQSEIERSMQRMAAGDADFAERLETEFERADDGQFAGLLIRNLENIQGDERDIIILSVCYGPGPDGRTRMNFGPINQAGGEKRLNVAFSRARKNMALISSMRHSSITNEYNDGANCLKKYLRYAEACSVAKRSVVDEVLRSLSGTPDRANRSSPDDRLNVAVREFLVANGYEVDTHVGQSDFRVDLAVRRPGDRQYRLGILVDGRAWYAQPDLLERELLKPQLLRNFGWTIEVIHARDWCEQTNECQQRLLHALG